LSTRPSLCSFRYQFHLLMQNNPRERIELASPWLAFDHRSGVAVAGVPTLHDSGGAEINVLGVVLAGELRGEQPHHMHSRWADIARHLPQRLAVSFGLEERRRA